jgi:hypothetical protein
MKSRKSEAKKSSRCKLELLIFSLSVSVPLGRVGRSFRFKAGQADSITSLDGCPEQVLGQYEAKREIDRIDMRINKGITALVL